MNRCYMISSQVSPVFLRIFISFNAVKYESLVNIHLLKPGAKLQILVECLQHRGVLGLFQFTKYSHCSFEKSAFQVYNVFNHSQLTWYNDINGGLRMKIKKRHNWLR